MKLKLTVQDGFKHGAAATGVTWSSHDEVITTSDDHVIRLCSTSKNQQVKLLSLPENIFPIAIGNPSKSCTGNLGKRIPMSAFALSSTDGNFHLVNKVGRIEKTVEAHRGAVLGLKWSFDGNSFATCGEDGQVKVWSRSGMLRSTLFQKNVSIYSLAWGPKSEQIVHTCGKQLVIRSIKANVQPVTWMAHDCIILKVDWSPINDLIISGGEDCKYKVWDSFGRQIFSSQPNEHPISALAWAPDGQQFVVGSYNSLRLCDKIGWCHSLEKPKTGSLLDLAWSPDGANLAAVGANGIVLFGSVVDRCLEWEGFEATVTGTNNISVTNVRDGSKDMLEFRDQLIKVSLGYGHLLAIGISQCYIYSVHNFNTPTIVDLKDAVITLVVQSLEAFLLVDCGQCLVYNYSGRLITCIKNASLRTDLTYPGCFALSCDTVAAKDTEDDKSVHLFESNSGTPLGDGRPIVHSIDVLSIGLNQKDSMTERRLAVLDKSMDLFLYQVRVYGRNRVVFKLGSTVTTFAWSETQNLMAAIRHDKLTVWYFPTISTIDKELLDLTVQEKDTLEGSGKYCTINSFYENQISIRRPEGSIVVFSISPYPSLLYNFASKNQWNQITNLCRNAKEDREKTLKANFARITGTAVVGLSRWYRDWLADSVGSQSVRDAINFTSSALDSLLWACFAGLATAAQKQNLAEIAYAAINKPDKVEHIRRIQELPSQEARNAESLLLAGQPKEAERVLIQAGLYFSAVMLNLSSYNWERALELANKSEQAKAVVLSTRHHYLSKLRRQEFLKPFLNCQSTSYLEVEKLRKTIAVEYQREANSPQA